MVVNSFIDSQKLKENGVIKPNQYFAHLLLTRVTSKVGPEGKRRSFSQLVIVGNGKGTAGLGAGKDATPGMALFKATQNAKKNMIRNSPRSDEPTLAGARAHAAARYRRDRLHLLTMRT